MDHYQYVKSIMKYHNRGQINEALQRCNHNPNGAIAYLANLPPPPNIKHSIRDWYLYFDPKNNGLSQEDIVCALHLSFGSDLRTVNFEKSVANIWNQFVPSDMSGIKISLEVFEETDGLGETIADYIAPIYLQIDEIGSLFPDNVVVPRQHIHDVLMAHGGSKSEAIAELRQYYPLKTNLPDRPSHHPPVPYHQQISPPSQQQQQQQHQYPSHLKPPYIGGMNPPPQQQTAFHGQWIPPPQQHAQCQPQLTHFPTQNQSTINLMVPSSQLQQLVSDSLPQPPPQQPLMPPANQHPQPSVVSVQSFPLTQHQQISTTAASVYRPPPNIIPPIPAPPPTCYPPRPHMLQRALLIGCNYVGQSGELRGCCNDVLSIKTLLNKTYGWSTDPKNMRLLTDDNIGHMRPTKDNIMTSLKWLVDDVYPGDALFFHFSGHGSQQPDPHGLEEDGMNEVILPVDYKRCGVITDDTINATLIRCLPDGVRLTVILDACHSGTGCDLPYMWDASKRRFVEETNPYHSLGDVTLFSGCMDEGTSCDVQSTRGAGGAMTMAFVSSLQRNPHPTYDELLEGLLKEMKRKGFHQKPQLSSSQEFDVGRPFLMNDAIPNSNYMIGRTIRKKFSVGGEGGFGSSSSASALQTLLTSMLFG